MMNRKKIWTVICKQCHGRFTVIGGEYIREELRYIPSRLKLYLCLNVCDDIHWIILIN